MSEKITPIREKWKGTLTDKERFNNQMHYKSVDRCFNMEFGYWDENYLEWKIFVDNKITNECGANQFFNFDDVSYAGVNTWQSHAMPTKVLEETENTVIRINHEGVVEEVYKNGPSTIPRYLRSSIEKPDDWKAIKEEYFSRTHPCRTPDYAYIDNHFKYTPHIPIGISTGSMIGVIRNVLTVEGLAYAIYDYPEMVEDMVNTSCQLVLDQLDLLLPRYRFDFASGWEDIACKNGPLVNMDFFKNVVVPAYEKINKKLKSHGIDIWWMDCDGDVRPLLPYFLDNGINCLFPYEVNSCCHPAELLNEYGGALRIMGGFDKLQMIAGKESIKAYMKSIEPLVAKGGFIPFCDHRCPPDVSEENYLYYLDLKEATFGMK